jgi:hypothetical protein
MLYQSIKCLKTTERNSYFTLIEVMLAVVIFLMVVSIAVMALSSTERTLRKVNRVNDRLAIRQAIDRLVNRAFKNAINFTWQDDDFKSQLVFSGEAHELLIPYLHRIDPTRRSGIRFLKLLQEDDKLIALYSSSPLLPWQDIPEQVNREVITSGIKSLSFLYANIDPHTQQVNLLETWDNNSTPYIPLGIQLEIEWSNGERDVWFRRTAGAGYRQQLGRRQYQQ